VLLVFKIIGLAKKIPFVRELLNFIDDALYANKFDSFYTDAFKLSEIRDIDNPNGKGAIDVIEIVRSGISTARYRISLANTIFKVIDFYRNS